MQREPQLRLLSEIPPEEVLALIESKAERDHLAMWFKVKPFWKPVLARVKAPRFRLRQHRNFGNSYGPFLYGQVLPHGNGSEITGRFRMHPLVRAFLVLWLSGVAAFGALGALQGPSPNSGGPRWLFPLAALAFAAFAVLMTRFGWWLGKNERRTISEFLEDLAARESPRPEPNGGSAGD